MRDSRVASSALRAALASRSACCAVRVNWRERALGLLERGRHRLLVARRAPAAPAPRSPRCASAPGRSRAAARSGRRRASTAASRRCRDRLTLVAGEADQADQADARKEIGGGDADVRRRRRELALGGDQVGPAPQQLLGRAERQRREIGDRQASAAGCGAASCAGDRRAATAPSGSRGDRRRGRSPPAAPAGSPRCCRTGSARATTSSCVPRPASSRALVRRRVSRWLTSDSLRHLEALLQAAQLEVVARHLGGDGRLRRVHARPADASTCAAADSLRAPVAAEEVELPVGGEAGVEGAAVRWLRDVPGNRYSGVQRAAGVGGDADLGQQLGVARPAASRAPPAGAPGRCGRRRWRRARARPARQRRVAEAAPEGRDVGAGGWRSPRPRPR